MNDRVSHVLSELRFWMWKARNYHAQRYISIITILATLGGLAFYSVNNPDAFVKKATAAGLVTYTDTGATKTLVVDGVGGKFLLVPDSVSNCGAGKASLWGLDYAASTTGIKVVNSSGTYNNFKGRACIDTANTDLTISNNAELQIAGTAAPLTFRSVTVRSGGTLSTPSANAKGHIAPYQGRPDFWVQKFTGFVRIDPGYTYSFKPDSSAFADDSVVIEAGNTDGLTTSIDSTTFSVVSWDWGGGACSLDVSFFSGTFCGKTGTIAIASGTTYSYTNNGAVAYYLPIRISHAEILADAKIKIHGKQVNASNGSVIYDGDMPLSWLRAPLKNADANNGKADTTAQGKMRYEYGDGASITQNAPPYVTRSFGNVVRYYYDPSVELGTTIGVSSFVNFGKVNDANFNFSWSNQNTGDPNIITNPFNNTQRSEGFASRIGAQPTGITDQPVMLENDMLQAHDPAVYGSGTRAGLKITITGNLTVDGGNINVNGKGLPGAAEFFAGSVPGASGVGGQGRQGDAYGPGWIQAWGAGTRQTGAPGSAWNNTTGDAGGAGGAGMNDGAGDWGGPGGGGGGVIGQGAPGRQVNNDADKTLFSSVDRYPASGNGGGGVYGVGGRLGGNSQEFVINDGQGSLSIWNANAFPGRYTYTTPAGMGGGGSLGLSRADSTFGNGYAGSGGASINITVSGDVQVINTSTVSANGEDGPASVNKAAGAGGAGSVTITSANNFTLDATSLVKANGGNTAAFQDSAGLYAKPGEGGGGLLRLRATSFLGSGWTGYDCTLGKPYTGQIGSMQTLGGSTQAGYGIIDLAYNPGNIPYCGATITTGGDITISKQIQQWNGSETFTNTDAKLDLYWKNSATNPTYWSNSVTTVPGAYVRIRIVVHNSDTSDRTVDISDSLPAGFQVITNSTGKNAYEICSPSSSCTAAPITITMPSGSTGGAVSVQSKSVKARTNYELYYIAQAINPL